MKKIECMVSIEKSNIIDVICEKEGYTRAEFNRRALDSFLNQFDLWTKRIQTFSFQCPDCMASLDMENIYGKSPKIRHIKHAS